jgi:hypothetical protein
MVSDDETRCIICGYEFPERPSQRNWRTWVAIGLLIVFLYPLLRFILRLVR